jgi:hypothetical protein
MVCRASPLPVRRAKNNTQDSARVVEIKECVHLGNPNVKCYDLLVDVEYYALYKKKSIAMDENHSTIVRPRDGGLIQDESGSDSQLVTGLPGAPAVKSAI